MGENFINDIYSNNGRALVITNISRHGFDLYAIVELFEEDKTKILATFFCLEMAVTAFHRLLNAPAPTTTIEPEVEIEV